MKISKKAEQKNFRVNTHYYTLKELERMIEIGLIYDLYGHWVVYANDCNCVFVKLDEYGHYTCAVKHYSSQEIFIEI